MGQRDHLVMTPEFNPLGMGTLYLGLHDQELERKERKFLLTLGLETKQVAHLARSIKPRDYVAPEKSPRHYS